MACIGAASEDSLPGYADVNLSGFHSIRINDQWRIILKWLDGEPHAVQIVDYH